MEKIQSFILRRNINEELWAKILYDYKINLNDKDLTFSNLILILFTYILLISRE